MADNLEVRGLELKIKASSGDVVNSLSQLQGALNGLKFNKAKSQVLNRIAGDIGNFAKTVNGIDSGAISKLTAFADAFNSLSNLKKPTNIPKDTASKLTEFTKVFESMDADALGNKIKAFSEAVAPLANMKLAITGKPGEKLTAFAQSINNLDISKLATSANAVNSALQPLASTLQVISVSMRNMPSGISVGAIARLTKESEIATPKVNALANALKKLKAFGRSVGNVASGLGRIGSHILPFRNLATSVTTAKKKFDNLFSSIKRIAFYRAIRTFIKSVTDGFRIGTENLYYYSQAVGTKFAPAMDLLATDLLYFRNSIGAAASPLIEKLAPAVDYATDRIVDMINVVNQLMAKLTGKSQWTKALKYPAKYAEETKNSAKAAKDYLLEFDELHVLNDDAGGRGADALDYSRMFEEKQLNQSFATWVDDFKNAIQNGDWTGAGKVLGEQLNKVVGMVDPQKLGKQIFGKVNNAIYFSQGFLNELDTKGWGTGLATFFNSAFNTLDTYALGNVLGTRVQKIIDFALGFVTTLDWAAAGTSLTNLLKGWFEAIDGESLGKTLSTAITGVFTFLTTIASDKELMDEIGEDIAGFLNGLDWYNIIYGALSTAGAILTAVFDILHKIVTETDWVTIGKDIYNGLKDALASIDWAELVTDVAETIYEIFKSAALLADEILGDIGTDIGKGISIALYHGYYDEETGEWVDITKQLVDNVEDLEGALADNIVSPFTSLIHNTALANGGLEEMKEHLDDIQGSMPFVPGQSGTAFGNLLSYQGASVTPQNIQPTAAYYAANGINTDTLDQQLEDIFRRLFTRRDSPMVGMFDTVGELIKTNIFGLGRNNVPSWIKNATDSVKGGSRAASAGAKSWKEYAQAIQGVSTDSKELSATTTDMDATISKIGEPIKSAQTAFSNLRDNGIKSFGELNNGLSTPLANIKSQIITAFGGLNNGLSTPLANIKSKIITAFGGAKDSVATTMTTTKNSVVNAVKGVNNDLTTPLNNIKSKIVNAFKDTNKQLNTPITNIRKRPTNAINGAITDLATPLSNIKKVITNTFKTANSTSISYLTAKDTGLHDKTVKAFENTNTDLQTPVSTIRDTVVNGFMGVINNLKSQDFVGNATGLWRDVKNNIIPIGNSILTAGELIANGMNAAFTILSNKIGGYKLSLPKEFGGGTISFNFPKLSDITVPRIPAMATGGLVTSPTTALIGEAGREAVMPLDSNTEWMDMLASRLVVGMANSATDANERPIQVHVTLDGREIYQNQEKVRRSIGYNVGGGAFA